MKLAIVDPSRELHASSLERAFNCMASSVLQAVDRYSTAAKKGTDAHLELENDFEVPVKLLRAAGIPEMKPESLRSEEGLVYNVNPEGPGHDFDLIYGTPDGYGQTSDGDAVVVWDYKTGNEVEHPSTNRQVRFYALKLARRFNVQSAYVAIIYLRDDKPPWVVWSKMESIDLDAYSVELAELAGARAKAFREKNADYKIGPWCKYCGSLAWCEPQGNLLRMAVAAKPWRPGESITPAEAMEAYESLRVLDETSSHAWEAVRAYATLEPIGPLRNGKYYKLTKFGGKLQLRESK